MRQHLQGHKNYYLKLISKYNIMKNIEKTSYRSALETVLELKEKYGDKWSAIKSHNAARMITQNQFKTGLDIAQYTANIIRKDLNTNSN